MASPTILVSVLKRMKYRGRWYNPGEQLEIQRKDKLIVDAYKWAEPIKKKATELQAPQPNPAEYGRRDLKAGPGKRGYTAKPMVAENPPPPAPPARTAHEEETGPVPPAPATPQDAQEQASSAMVSGGASNQPSQPAAAATPQPAVRSTGIEEMTRNELYRLAQAEGIDGVLAADRREVMIEKIQKARTAKG